MTIEDIILNFGIEVTYLNPDIASSLGRKSKIGGNSAFLLPSIDICKYCNTQQDLIIELFKKEHPEFYFPDNCDYAQVKTCYNVDCPWDEDRNIEFFLDYGNTQKIKPNPNLSEHLINTAFFSPQITKEVPYNSYESNDLRQIKKSLGEEKYESLIIANTGRIGTKLNGDVFRWNEFDIPECGCGNLKPQILQISSYEPNMHPKEKRRYWELSSSLGVNIGHTGNFHFFLCRDCGIDTLDYKWDSI